MAVKAIIRLLIYQFSNVFLQIMHAMKQTLFARVQNLVTHSFVQVSSFYAVILMCVLPGPVLPAVSLGEDCQLVKVAPEDREDSRSG